MIQTLNILSERVIRDLSGGDIPSDSPYKKAFVIEHIRDALREDLKLEILQRRGTQGVEDDRSAVTQYIASFEDVEVKVHKTIKRVYIDLPSSYMSLKANKGIYWISSMTTPSRQMIPIANPGITVNLPHADLERQNFGYYVEGMRVFWMRDIKKDGHHKILLKLIVPAPDTWGMDDPLPIIPENLARVMDMVKNRILNRVPNDRLNDNNPNLRAANV